MNQTFTLTKDFRFESAHRLAKGYEGKCKNIHGHSWNGSISIECEDLDAHDFAVDFSLMKKFTKMIEDEFDHKILLYKEDKKLIALCEEMKYEVVVMDANPTCETIAKNIYLALVGYIIGNEELSKNKIKVKSVTIKETCTTSCTYELR